MTTRNSAKPTATNPDRTLKLDASPDETSGQTRAKAVIGPVVRHTALAEHFAAPIFGADLKPPISDTAEVIAGNIGKAVNGDLTLSSQMLAAQAMSLDGIFTDLASRAALNRGEYLGATETYMRLALKAQSACRATIEALAKLHQPREQIVKHVHVNEGGQAVVADQFHQHTGGRKNGKSNEQPHATETAEGAGERTALPGPDPLGNRVPVPGGERKVSVPNARRRKPRRA